jgi:hypothetical protein
MLSMSWNGSNGAVHFTMTCARKSLRVCACAAGTKSASAHSAAEISLMEFLPVFVVVITRGARAVRAVASYVPGEKAATASRSKKSESCAE